jgi:hypothetical protein
MVDLAQQLIARQLGQFQPEDTEDRYASKLREVIAAGLTGEGITPEKAPDERPDNVTDLMAALKASLAQEGKPGARAAGDAPWVTRAQKTRKSEGGGETGTGQASEPQGVLTASPRSGLSVRKGQRQPVIGQVSLAAAASPGQIVT